MSTATIQHLTITDAGPIENLTIPVPPEGGIVVLSGRNGSGKTTALNATESLIGGKPTITARDGSQKAVVTGFGATLRVGRRASRTGELEVSSLEGKLSPASLVDPGLKSPDAADAMRIKALLQLVNAEPDMAAFYGLLENQATFEKYVPEDMSDETDVVALAGKIKRSLEQTARREEAVAQNEAGKASAYKKAVEDIDTSNQPDVDQLQAELEAAVAHQSRLNEQAIQADRLGKLASLARTQLASASSSSGEDLTESITAASQTLENCSDIVGVWERQLAQASTAVEITIQNEAAAQRELTAAKLAKSNAAEKLDALQKRDIDQASMRAMHDASIAKWKESIDAAEQCDCPTVVDLEHAATAIKAIRESIERAAVVRHAAEQVAKATEHQAKSDACYKTAEKLRESAKATDDVLSDLVSRCGTDLTVRAGRLMVTTRRGLTLFSELSHGERWKIAIDVALRAFPVNSDHLPVLTVEQEAWEGLDPQNRAIIAEHARERKVLILTAECSDSDTVTAAEFN
jgi:energy-coupling factor transporter ATP-binding protein EcfA2